MSTQPFGRSFGRFPTAKLAADDAGELEFTGFSLHGPDTSKNYVNTITIPQVIPTSTDHQKPVPTGMAAGAKSSFGADPKNCRYQMQVVHGRHFPAPLAAPSAAAPHALPYYDCHLRFTRIFPFSLCCLAYFHFPQPCPQHLNQSPLCLYLGQTFLFNNKTLTARTGAWTYCIYFVILLGGTTDMSGELEPRTTCTTVTRMQLQVPW
ncbi:hypothetical protein EDB86DRAFT_260266 [Lactarius hatsudake]|nr:hypothetical protein EDB86DRAFT_260266 [Lactarius hatsudake]